MFGSIVGWILLAVFGAFFGFIIICACAYVLSDFFYYQELKHHKEKFSFLTLGLLFGLFLCLFNPIYGNYRLEKLKEETYNTFQYNIVSLERASSIEGHSVLGTGSVHSYQCYYVYRETNYGYKLEELECRYTYLREDDSINPSVYLWKEKGDLDEYYTIYVPVGSVASYVFQA